MKEDNHIRGMAYFKNNELVDFKPFNDIQKDKEIERLKEEVEEWKHNATRINNENNKLRYIIKEAREYIVSQKLHKIIDTTGGLTYEERKLLEILRGEE